MKKMIAITMAAMLMMGCAALAEISKEDAKRIALDNVGFTADSVHFTECHTDYEHGRRVIEIEFNRDGMEYEFDIDAKNGKILDLDIDALD